MSTNTLNPESQRALARNLVCGLAVAYHGARHTGRPYSLMETNAVGMGSGWVGESGRWGDLPGHTLLAEVVPDVTPDHVVMLAGRLTVINAITDPDALAIMDTLGTRLERGREPGVAAVVLGPYGWVGHEGGRTSGAELAALGAGGKATGDNARKQSMIWGLD